MCKFAYFVTNFSVDNHFTVGKDTSSIMANLFKIVFLVAQITNVFLVANAFPRGKLKFLSFKQSVTIYFETKFIFQ